MYGEVLQKSNENISTVLPTCWPLEDFRLLVFVFIFKPPHPESHLQDHRGSWNICGIEWNMSPRLMVTLLLFYCFIAFKSSWVLTRLWCMCLTLKEAGWVDQERKEREWVEWDTEVKWRTKWGWSVHQWTNLSFSYNHSFHHSYPLLTVWLTQNPYDIHWGSWPKIWRPA